MGQQATSTVEIVNRILGDHALKIRHCVHSIAKLQCANATAIERIERISASRDRPVKGGSRLFQLAVLHVEVPKLLEVAG